MKVALITDLHYGIRNDNSAFYSYQKKSNDNFFQHIRTSAIDAVYVLGDVFDRRKYLNYVTAQNCRKDFLEPLSGLGKPIHIIAGNHDEYYKNAHRPNSLKEIIDGRYENIRTYDEPIEVGPFLLVPWITDTNRVESLRLLKTSSKHICLGHFEVQGASMYRGIASDHGFAASEFDRFDLTCSGHFHTRSVRGNVHYIGAAYEFIWSDHGDPRGYSILDTESLELTFHQNPLTIFKAYTYDDEEMLIKAERDIAENDFREYNNCYVKIVAAKKTNQYVFDTLLDKIYKSGPISITVVEDMSTFQDTLEDEILDQAESTENILDSYIDGLQLSIKRDQLKKLMREIYHEAVTLDNV